MSLGIPWLMEILLEDFLRVITPSCPIYFSSFKTKKLTIKVIFGKCIKFKENKHASSSHYPLKAILT